MRVGTFQSYASQTSRMAELQSTLDRLQSQIATGKRILDPSDDPLGANRVVSLQRSIDNNQQYMRNMNLITTQLSMADSAADTMVNQLTRAKELAITAANGTMTATDRQNVSTELGQLIDQMVALANTQNADGNYIFSGAKVGTAAFARDNLGNIVWQGDGQPPSVPVNADVTVSTGANGLDMLSIDGAAGRQTILQSLVQLKATLDNPPATPTAFKQAMSDALTDINAGVNKLVDQRAVFGARMAQVESESERLRTLETTLTTAQSSIESLDVAGAIIQLQSAMTLLQASQQSFAQIKKLSLFQYL